MEYTVGYLCVHNCLDLMRIKAASVTVSNLTMALRAYFSARSLSHINHVLSGVSMRDGLTGLYNRLGYHELAYPLYRETGKNGKKMSVLFLDMDRLKQLNDTYGHGEGDKAINCVAAAILDKIPKDAVPVRYGGDEFLLLIPDLDDEHVHALLDLIITDINALARAQGLRETPDISSGFVLADPATGKSLDEYVQEADVLMYSAKRGKKAQRT